MDLKELETFIKVAELKSFSKTAVELSVTQPTITNHIQSLEKELNTRLINRKGRNISLTDSGKVLYRYAIDILNSCKMAKSEISTDSSDLSGHITIQSSTTPRRHLLPNIINSFIQEYEGITFTITDDNNKDAIEKINNRQLDLAIVDYKTKDANIEFVKIFEDKLVLIVPNKAIDKNFDTISKEIFNEYRFILKDDINRNNSDVLNQIEKFGVPKNEVSILGSSTDLETIKTLVSLGSGISILGEINVKEDLKQNNYKVAYLENMDITKEFYLAFPRNRYLSPMNEAFKNHILKNKTQ